MKNKFIKSTLILIMGGFITKILGMVIKIIVTRNISLEAMSNYMLVIPSYNLFITIVSGGLQIAVSKLVSENKLQKKKIIINALIIAMTISILLIILVVLLAKPISILLHNEDLYIPILSTLLSIPFIGISNVLKGYFFGQNKMHVQVISNFLEQVIRIIMFITILPNINNDLWAVTFIIGSNLVNEFLSVIVLSLFINNKKINTKDIKIDNEIKKEILKTSIPSTLSRIIGTISYFFEPIIITNLLLINGFSKSYIRIEYGIITGYVMQLLLLPSFFSMAISQSIIPLISNAFINKKYDYIKRKIKEIIFLSFMIGFIYILILLINPTYFMKLIYNQTKGINYLKQMSFIFILLYIQGPLSSILQSINKAKDAMKITVIGVILKLLLTIILSFLHFGIYAYIYPMLINILFVTLLDYIVIKKNINSF